MKITKISDYEGSTLLGMNGGMVESPDEKRIIYARKANLTRPETEIWVCDINLENHRKIFSVNCMNHNGPSATFINNHDIVFRDSEDGLSVFRIMNIDTGEIHHKIFAKESHCAENGQYPFSVSKEFLNKNPNYSEIDECGIYILDTYADEIKRIASDRDILRVAENAGLTPDKWTASVSHVQLNPSATSVMMRLSVKECPVFGALGCIDIDTGKTHIIPDKPVHQLWYDNDTYMATRQFNKGKHIEMKSSYIARFSKDGEELEVLGGIANHMDGSADREFFAGDRCYPEYSPDIYLYKKGIKEPVCTIEMPDFQDIVWKKQVHPNPSFSRNQKRLYFNMPQSNDRTTAVFADISEYVK